jgi:AcrR family transcriptional regulator
MERDRSVPSEHLGAALSTPPKPANRPRVTGEREDEILDATLSLLLEVGYDRLTLDAVARKARAGKATLYRRWESKPSLVIDALMRAKRSPHRPAPDSGTLRGDLLQLFCGPRGIAGQRATSILGAVVTALTNDPEFAALFREQFIAPKIAVSQEIYRRARERGEIRPDLDLEVIGPALAGILLHRAFVLGQPYDDTVIERVVDHVILPAVLHPLDAGQTTSSDHSTESREQSRQEARKA